jgi:hypothetical protein
MARLPDERRIIPIIHPLRILQLFLFRQPVLPRPIGTAAPRPLGRPSADKDVFHLELWHGAEQVSGVEGALHVDRSTEGR